MAQTQGTGGIPGVPILVALVGSILLWSGIKNASVAETVRALVGARPVQSGPSQIDAARRQTSGGTSAITARGTATGQNVAAIARDHLGVPYRWAGETPDGWDCSGMVTWVLTQAGVKLPDQVHTTAFKFHVWTGAVTIPRSQCAPGDLVSWPSHIGIATSRTTMIHAPKPFDHTRESTIWEVPAPIIRRPKAYVGLSK